MRACTGFRWMVSPCFILLDWANIIQVEREDVHGASSFIQDGLAYGYISDHTDEPLACDYDVTAYTPVLDHALLRIHQSH